MITPGFSFRYGEKEIVSDGLTAEVLPNGLRYFVDEALTVTLEERKYPKSDAVYWVLGFENPSDHDSAVLSDICDCDVILSLPA